MMTDTQKIEVLKQLMAAFWETDDGDGSRNMLVIIDEILNMDLLDKGGSGDDGTGTV